VVDTTYADDAAVLRHICLGGSGQVTVVGDGPSAQWDGALTCPPVSFTDCQSVTPTYHHADVHLIGSNGLGLTIYGEANGCGVTRTFRAEFEGSR
jgi:hypothetical protein